MFVLALHVLRKTQCRVEQRIRAGCENRPKVFEIEFRRLRAGREDLVDVGVDDCRATFDAGQ